VSDYNRGAMDALMYVLRLLEANEGADIAETLQGIKEQLEREASKRFKTRFKPH